MSIPNAYYYQQTGQQLGEYNQSNYTSVPKVPEKTKETTEKTSPKVSTIYSSAVNEGTVIHTKTYSQGYIAFNTYALIEKINKELQSWETLGTDDALIHISNIKDILQENADYLTQKSETRILLSMLELLFENNNWETMDKKDVNYLQRELKRFDEGEVNWESLSMFSKQLYRKRMYLLRAKSHHGKKQKEEN